MPKRAKLMDYAYSYKMTYSVPMFDKLYIIGCGCAYS